jgi:hypothetical protein
VVYLALPKAKFLILLSENQTNIFFRNWIVVILTPFKALVLKKAKVQCSTPAVRHLWYVGLWASWVIFWWQKAVSRVFFVTGSDSNCEFPNLFYESRFINFSNDSSNIGNNYGRMKISTNHLKRSFFIRSKMYWVYREK